MPAPDNATARAFFEQRFQPWQATQEDGSAEGMVTGYYEPLLKGDRVRTARARFPLYAAPDDLITVDLASVYPELKNLRLRGRLVGNKLVPYPTRKEIEAGNGNGFKGKPIAWAENPVDLFFLQIQGSGRIELPDGSHMRVGYADQNGHPYLSIGKLLVERGELKLEQASMQGIKDWGAKNPDKLPELLASNPSFVFFRELPNGLTGPLGALGVPLTGGRSIAVDPRFIPLGAPVFLATTQPNSPLPLNRLVMAQDTGGAIRGGVRADFFWGFGEAAGARAGRMKQRGRMWVLLPKAWPEVTATPARQNAKY
jgi:membrane-bound lytic murein transglycosylase A